MPRTIIHLDADAFFASVEQAADARLRGKPIAVGGEKRGIIASASYEARKFGVYTPMPTVRARKLCPRLIVIPGDYERYEHFSRWMFSYAYDFTPEVEQTSIDEGYFDLTGSRKPALEVAQTLSKAIHQSMKITVSEGIGSNKLISQIASKLRKPSGLEVVPHGEEASFLAPLAANWLPGIGAKTGQRLNAAGLATIAQIADTPLDLLQLVLGNQADTVRQYARGIDDRPLVLEREAQVSFGEQETFGRDVTDEEYVEAVLRRMADKLMAKIRAEGRCMRTLTVKVRYNDMAEDQRSESLLEPTDLETDIYSKLRPMLKSAWQRRVSLRLVCLRFTNIYTHWSRTELGMAVRGEQHESHRRLALTLDGLHQKHGNDSIFRGYNLKLQEGPLPEIPTSNRRRAEAPVRPRSSGIIKASYIPLNVKSCYSFLDSTLRPADLVRLAVKHEMPAIGLADTGGLHGIVEFAHAVKKSEKKIKPLFGTEIQVNGSPLLLYVMNATGYHHLCKLLSGQRITQDDDSNPPRTEELKRKWSLHEVAALSEGLLAISPDPSFAELFPGRFYEAVSAPYFRSKSDQPAILCPRIHYEHPRDRMNFDIAQSIRTLTLLRERHAGKRQQGAYHFRTPREMWAVGASHPQLLQATFEVAERCEFEISLNRVPMFPKFDSPDGLSSKEYLRQLVMRGLEKRYRGNPLLEKHRLQVETELAIITDVGYEDYFLVVWDLLQECRKHGIEWITRGSAADSLVCYCLEISGVCPIRFNLYFQRFLNRERMAMQKLPDIDVDFAHDRKDDVVQLIFQKYGDQRCAMVGGFSTFQARSAFAEVAKVLGMAEREIRHFTEHFPWSFGGWPNKGKHLKGEEFLKKLQENPECGDLPLHDEPFRTAVLAAGFLDGMPRYPKMHPCGVIIAPNQVHELTPTFISNKGLSTTHFDMDSVELIGLVKMDILAQGGLAAMRDAREMIRLRHGKIINLEDLTADDAKPDPDVWKMIADGGGRGVHHIESPAMVSLCRMTNVDHINGLIAIVSVIRPGAANENKKLSFTRRYQGMEEVPSLHPSLDACLADTFGLVVYEEHILQICIEFAKLPAGRADDLRRALNKEKNDIIEVIKEEFFESARHEKRGEETIIKVWDLVNSFRGYAFCKAHSTAYGVEAYQAAWLKRYHAPEFMTAVLSNGKGFYTTLVYVLECLRLGIKFLSPTANAPGPAFMLEGDDIRVPLTRTKGLRDVTIQQMLGQRKLAKFRSLQDFYERVRPSAEEMEAMIQVGGFDEFGQSRTAQFWEAQKWNQHFKNNAVDAQLWLIPPPAFDLEILPRLCLQEPAQQERLEWEMDLLGFTVSDHPLALHPDIDWSAYIPLGELEKHVGKIVLTCGLIIEQRTHHQADGGVMKFMTLADRTGIVETELFAEGYRSYGLATVRYPVLEIEATVEPFENGNGFSLRIRRAGAPKVISRLAVAA